VTDAPNACRQGSALRLALTATVIVGCAGSTPGAPMAPPTPLALSAASAPPGFPAGGVAATAPVDNPLTEARAQLGRSLFYDRRLSRTAEIACSSCHQRKFGFADSVPVSAGVEGRHGNRNAPALVNLAWNSTFFWDGRAHSLEEQAGMPIENPVEMDLSLADAVARLNADVATVSAFTAAFDQPPSAETLRQALASFVRTLVSSDSPYDRHVRGDASAFGDSQRRGEALFSSDRTGCFHCHPAGELTNDGFFNNGSYTAGGDPGLQMITGRPGDLGKFKVPGLRNVAASAPYMHDGSVPTLEAVIEQYARGGRGDPSTDPQIAPLSLTAADKDDLLAFLQSLTDDGFLADPRFSPPAP
jgi:cytochrome c peroxidase